MNTTFSISDLENAVACDLLAAGDAKFARSLIKSAKTYGKLTPNQGKYIPILMKRALGLVPPPPVVSLEGSLAPTMAMLQLAGGKVKYPKITLKTKSGDKVVMYIAGEKSRYTGQMQVTGGSYGSAYYGRATKDGVFTPSLKSEVQDRMPDVVELLTDFAKDPIQAASAYGHMNGVCCFCNATLTDPKSKKVGYGPVCAGHFGLPWGV